MAECSIDLPSGVPICLERSSGAASSVCRLAVSEMFALCIKVEGKPGLECDVMQHSRTKKGAPERPPVLLSGMLGSGRILSQPGPLDKV